MDGASFEAAPGDFVQVRGRNGSGKSTLLRIISGSIPHNYGGDLSGTATLNGVSTGEKGPYGWAGEIGLMFQDPVLQTTLEIAGEELAFGALSLGMKEAKAGALVRRMGLSTLQERRMADLSLGETTLVILGSLLAMDPALLLVDEVGQSLDEENRTKARRILEAFLANGGMVVENATDEGLGLSGSTVHLSEERSHLPKGIVGRGRDKPIMRCKGLTKHWGKNVLFGPLDLEICQGDVVILKGGNGTGKTTLMKMLGGLQKPDGGSVSSDWKTVGWVTGRGEEILTGATVHSDVSRCEKVRKGTKRRVRTLLEKMGKVSLLERFPGDMSLGEKRAVSLVLEISRRPEILFLDEELAHIDQEATCLLTRELQSYVDKGGALVLSEKKGKSIHRGKVVPLGKKATRAREPKKAEEPGQ